MLFFQPKKVIIFGAENAATCSWRPEFLGGLFGFSFPRTTYRFDRLSGNALCLVVILLRSQYANYLDMEACNQQSPSGFSWHFYHTIWPIIYHSQTFSIPSSLFAPFIGIGCWWPASLCLGTCWVNFIISFIIERNSLQSSFGLFHVGAWSNAIVLEELRASSLFSEAILIKGFWPLDLRKDLDMIILAVSSGLKSCGFIVNKFIGYWTNNQILIADC